MFVDPEFQFLDEKLVSNTLNTTAAHDHVLKLERHIQVINERMREHHANLPLPSFTRRMKTYPAKHVVMFLNVSPTKIRLSNT